MKDRDLKHRINGAKEIVKITKAMQLVSAAKMMKAEKRMILARDFLKEMKDVMGKVGFVETPLAVKRETAHKTFIVIAGDKGLCGDYNHKVLDYALNAVKREKEVLVYPVGQFAREFFKKENIKQSVKYVHLMQSAVTDQLRDFSYELAEDFLKGETDEIDLIYTAVSEKSVANQEPITVKLLPTEPEENDGDALLEYKKDIDSIIKQYLWSEIAYALCSAEYAVNFKCMKAMQKATTNGNDLVDDLQKTYNHLRQEKITGALMDTFASESEERR